MCLPGITVTVNNRRNRGKIMHTIKKFIAIAFAASVLSNLAACGQNTQSGQSASEKTIVKIGVVGC